MSTDTVTNPNATVPAARFKRWDLVRSRHKDYTNYMGGYARIVTYHNPTAYVDGVDGDWRNRYYTDGYATIRYGQQPTRWANVSHLEVVGYLEKYKFPLDLILNLGEIFTYLEM